MLGSAIAKSAKSSAKVVAVLKRMKFSSMLCSANSYLSVDISLGLCGGKEEGMPATPQIPSSPTPPQVSSRMKKMVTANEGIRRLPVPLR